MEKHEEILLQLLENEGKEIARHRKELLKIINSGKRINCSKILKICRRINAHIDLFDQLDRELSDSENLISNPNLPALNASGL